MNSPGCIRGNRPRPWSDHQVFNPGTVHLDLAADGLQFAVVSPPENAGQGKGALHATFLRRIK